MFPPPCGSPRKKAARPPVPSVPSSASGSGAAVSCTGRHGGGWQLFELASCSLPRPGAQGAPGMLPGPDRGSVAVEHLGLVLVPGRGRPVRVDDQGPAPAVDRDLVMEPAQKYAVADSLLDCLS